MTTQRLARLIPFALYLALIACYQILLVEPLSLWGAHIALSSLMALLVAVYKTETVAIWFAVSAMFLTHTGDPAAAGVMMIVATVVVIAANYLKSRLNMESLMSRLTITITGCLILELLRAAFVSTTDLLFVYVRYTLPSVGYTSVVALVFFLIKDGYITSRRVREMF